LDITKSETQKQVQIEKTEKMTVVKDNACEPFKEQKELMKREYKL
jgi:hypothetical protein